MPNPRTDQTELVINLLILIFAGWALIDTRRALRMVTRNKTRVMPQWEVVILRLLIALVAIGLTSGVVRAVFVR